MANREHLDLLQRGIEGWNIWRMRHPEIRPDLSDANLSGADLSDANLSKANLSGADLSDANLSKANLSGADLSYTDLYEADFHEADLSNAELQEAKFVSANLTKAKLFHVITIGATFFGADLSDANLSEAELTETLFEQTILTGADMNHAIVGWTIFGDLDLRGAKRLETVLHEDPSTIGIDTLELSEGNIPEAFLRGAGLLDTMIDYVHALVSRPIKYHTCFISYSSWDSIFARLLHEDLQRQGVRCWFAPEDMDIGDKIRPRIDESIRIYDKLVLILSQASVESNWVAYEVERALNKEPAGIPNVLFPIRLDDTVMHCTANWVQDIHSTRHIGDFTQWKDPNAYQQALNRLLRSLNTTKPQS